MAEILYYGLDSLENKAVHVIVYVACNSIKV